MLAFLFLATVEMRQCGREVSHHDLARTNSEDAMRVGVAADEEDIESSSGVIARIVKPPLKMVKVVSYNRCVDSEGSEVLQQVQKTNIVVIPS